MGRALSQIKQKIQIVVICEDKTTAVFIRRYLEAIGYELRKVRFLTSPSGRGAGEAYVRVNYAIELAQYRKRNPAYWRLIVHVDADTGTIQAHEEELAAVAIASGQPPRLPNEGIVHLIPKRNIETWIHSLLGNLADEVDDYKLLYKKQSENSYCQPAATKLVESVRDTNFSTDLPSLQSAVVELRTKLNGSR